MKRLHGVIAVAIVAMANAAAACGYCVEDRIAAVYDHALTLRAAGGKLQIAYFAWDGPVARSSEMRAKIVSAVQGTGGVDGPSVRVSMEPAAIAVAFDPARVKREQLDASMRRRLSALKIDLTSLQTSPPPPRP
ncbi:hypothetical protein [Caenimonas aquaedulcis]|uniref:Uncharacterized protein n=1 Tax=Caenimonas aquaedulcis TaxID=2793270 RepID=A0A931H215_9BURK|nr:hypothetical protein [Caenimonas aquaedulcis]MBG9387044.1 hypothetical protein [Caenimonas aquaedulcis]